MNPNQTLQEKFPHLEVSVLKLSEVQRDNETKRIDSEFFRKADLTIKNKLLAIQSKYLSYLISFNSRYSQPNYDDTSSLKIINSQYIRNEFIDYENAKFGYGTIVPKEAILINSTGVGTLGRVNINLLDRKFSIDSHINVLIVKDKNELNPCYLMIFLQTKYGQSQINRYYSGTSGQIEIYPRDFNNFLIPLLPMPFQLEIEKLVKDSHQALEQSKTLYKEAEDLLYIELGLNPQNPLASVLNRHCEARSNEAIHNLAYFKDSIANTSARFQNIDCHDSANAESRNDINFAIKSLKESFLKTGRLDSEYYQVKYEEIEKRIKTYANGYYKLKDIVVSFSGGFAFSSNEYLENGDLALIRINNIKNANLDMNNAVYLNDEAISLSPKDKVKKGDILISMSGSIGLSCVARENLHAMVNQRILKISIDDFNADVLVLLLNSVLCKLQFERIGTGGVQTNLATSDILNILIPKINPNTQDSIASHIQQSFTLRAEAKALLNEAKAKVESAIIGGGGGVNNASFVAFRIQIFRIYFPQIKAKLRDSKKAYRLGEWELLENLLGLKTLSFSKNSFDKNVKSFKFSKNSYTQKLNISIQSLSQSFGVSSRLDSEYYQSKYEKNEAVIKSKPYARLKDIVAIKKSIEPGSEAYRESGIPFIRVSNLSPFDISQSEVFLDSKDFENGELESLCPKKHTILLSKDGSVGISYCLENDLECVTSGAILHLTIKNKALILPQYLSLVLNALPTKLQAQRDSGGSIIAHWKISEIENLLIPLLELSIQEKIESKITQSFALRAKSKELLEKAKAKVEEKISLLSPT